MPACAVALCCRHRAAIPLGLQMSLPVLPRILDRPRAVWYVKPPTSRAAQADLPRSGSRILDDDVASRAGLLLWVASSLGMWLAWLRISLSCY